MGALPRRELANVWPRLDRLVAASRTAARWRPTRSRCWRRWDTA
jgi:hypothetical protein